MTKHLSWLGCYCMSLWACGSDPTGGADVNAPGGGDAAGDVGASAEERAAFEDFLGRLPTAVCEWWARCGEDVGDVAECAEDVGDDMRGDVQGCEAALTWYLKQREALEGCLANPTTACASEDITVFCPAFGDFDFERACATDCRQAAYACAAGFTCESTDGGWRCLEEGGGPTPTPDCVETTFEVTNWSGPVESNSFYTGSSWNLDSCTQIQSGPLKITVRCPKDAFGDARLISEGCGVLGIAAPGNILTYVGAEGTCHGRTVTNETIVCEQTCRRTLAFRISSGPCP